MNETYERRLTGMNTERSLKTNASITPPRKNRIKNPRRHTRVQLDSLRPIPTNLQNSQCPKCQGCVRTEAGESTRQIIIRCLNCGWQPHFQAPIIQETEEARMFRNLTAQFISEGDWDRISVNF
jgi:hypothetical protein